jgi:hypothetical protein
MKRLLLCSVVLASFTSSRAEAEPAWCAPVAGKLLHGNVKDALTSADPRVAIPSIIAGLCHATPNTEEVQRAREIEAARQRMMKRLAMTEADWIDAAEWASEHQGKLMSTSLDYDRKKAWSALTPIEQFAAITHADDEASYVADTFGSNLSEVGRFAYAQWCFGSRRGPVEWAVCQPDLAIDPAKLAVQLRTSGTGYQRMALRIDFFEYAAKLKEHAAKVKETIAKDSAYEKVFAVAAQGRKTALDEKLVALALAMDDARVTNSRKAYAGCAETTWPVLKAAIAAIPAAKFANISDDAAGVSALERAAGVIANDPNGYLAALSFAMCHRADEKQDYLVRSLGGALVRWPGFRGPRTSAITAILNSGIEPDDRGEKLEYPSVRREWIGDSTGSSGGARGVIAKLDRKGATTVVTFVKKMVTGPYCAQYKTTNRIIHITSSGNVINDRICVRWETVTVDTSPRPQTVDARYTEGLKPGMLVWTTEDVVAAAFAKSDSKLPSIIAGVVVK